MWALIIKYILATYLYRAAGNNCLPAIFKHLLFTTIAVNLEGQKSFIHILNKKA